MRSRATRLFAILVAALLLAGPWASSQAQQPTIGHRALLAPIADVVGSSAWLVAVGQDPRLAPPVGGAGPWAPGPAPLAAATPDDALRSSAAGTQVVSRQVGAVSVSAQPHLAVNPLDAEHLVLGISALDLPSAATYVSHNGGDTWEGPFQAPHAPGDVVTVGGPVIAFDRMGTVWLAARSLGFEQLAAGTGEITVPRTSVTISRSTDGGVTWGEPVTVALSSIEPALALDETDATRGELAFTFLDEPWLTVGPDPQRPDRDRFVVSYTEFRVRHAVTDASGTFALANSRVESTILVQRSTDGGASWDGPVPASPTSTTASPVMASPAQPPPPADVPSSGSPPVPIGPPAPATPPHVYQGARSVLLADGTLLLAYLDATQDGPQAGLARVMITGSEDGGQTFAEPSSAGIFHEIKSQPRTAFLRWWGSSFPRIAAGPDGAVVIAVTARPTNDPGDDGDVLLLRSPDRGATWQAPLPLPDAAAASQFFAEVAYQADGTLLVAWADMRQDPLRVGYDLYVASSDDQGETWRNLGGSDDAAPGARVSDATANSTAAAAGGRYLGDRIALDAGDDLPAVVWPRSQFSMDGRGELQVAFGRPVE